jgi:RHH-type transcriptional regulator, rel operon repressor / antitoxin RelB
MLAIRLPHKIEARLDRLAKKTGRSKTYYATQAILEHIEDLEDLAVAEQRLKELRDGRSETVPYSEVRRLLGLGD